MSLVTTTLIPALEKRLPKVISPKAHGVVDYAYSAFFLGLGLLTLRSNKRAAAAALATGGFLLAESLLTDYPGGVKPVFSFATHGKIDAAFASASWVIPQVFGLSGKPAARIYKTSALVSGVVVGLTDWDSTRARAETDGQGLLAFDDGRVV